MLGAPFPHAGGAFYGLGLNFVTSDPPPKLSALTLSGGANGTRRNAAGEIVAAVCPRIDHDASGTLLGLLIEEARTNHFVNSDAPESQTSGSLGTGSYTLWLEGAGSVEVAANTASVTGAGTATAGNPVTFAVTSLGTVDYTVTGEPDRVQSENGAFPTSYIPTAGTAVTRTADIVTVESATLGAAGTVFVDFSIANTVGSDRRVVRLLTDTSNHIDIFIDESDDDAIEGLVVNGGVSQAAISSGVAIDSQRRKVALAWAADDFGISAAAQTAVTDDSGTIPSMDEIWIGRLDANSQFLNGHIRRFGVRAAREADAVLETLTA